MHSESSGPRLTTSSFHRSHVIIPSLIILNTLFKVSGSLVFCRDIILKLKYSSMESSGAFIVLVKSLKNSKGSYQTVSADL